MLHSFSVNIYDVNLPCRSCLACSALVLKFFKECTYEICTVHSYSMKDRLGLQLDIPHAFWNKYWYTAQKDDLNEWESTQQLEVRLYLIFRWVTSHQDPVPKSFDTSEHCFEWIGAVGPIFYWWFASFANCTWPFPLHILLLMSYKI